MVVSSSTGLVSFAARTPFPPISFSLSSSLFLSPTAVVVAPRLKPRKPGNDQLNETSSALMHSPLWLVACLLALPTGYTTRGITLKLHSSYRCVHYLPPLVQSAALYTYSRITTGLLATPPFTTAEVRSLMWPSRVRYLSNSNAPKTRDSRGGCANRGIYLPRSGRCA